MGNPVQNVSRRLGTAEVNAKYYPGILSQFQRHQCAAVDPSCAAIVYCELSCLISISPRSLPYYRCAPVCARRPGHLRCSAREWQIIAVGADTSPAISKPDCTVINLAVVCCARALSTTRSSDGGGGEAPTTRRRKSPEPPGTEAGITTVVGLLAPTRQPSSRVAKA